MNLPFVVRLSKLISCFSMMTKAGHLNIHAVFWRGVGGRARHVARFEFQNEKEKEEERKKKEEKKKCRIKLKILLDNLTSWTSTTRYIH